MKKKTDKKKIRNAVIAVSISAGITAAAVVFPHVSIPILAAKIAVPASHMVISHFDKHR